VIINDPLDSTRSAEFDNYFQAILNIPAEHHEVHEGDMYYMYKCDTAMANNDTIEIGFIAPVVASPQKRVHLVFEYEAEGTGNFQVISGVTALGVGGGAAFTPLNRNRGSANTSSVTVPVTGQTGAAITYAGGTTIWIMSWGGTSSSTTKDRATSEWVLQPSGSYVFRLTNTSGGAQNGCISIIWYEHTDD